MRMTLWQVYVLECAKEVLYVGSTRDLDARMDQHTGRIGFTSRRRPLKLLWCLEFGDISEAYAAERRLHGWSRAKSWPSQRATPNSSANCRNAEPDPAIATTRRRNHPLDP